MKGLRDNDMKISIKRQFLVMLAAGMFPLTGHAHAALNMTAKEEVQAISWTIEGVTIFTIVVVFGLIWRSSMRDLKNRRSKQDDSSR
jgi:membrane protein implicated in regulation of membrane protease activity